MKKGMKKLLTVAFVGLLAVGIVGCGGASNEGTNNEQKPNQQTGQGEQLSGSITLVGSDSMQNVVGLLAEKFEEKNPEVKIEVQGGGSGASFEPVRTGVAQLGLVSRKLKDEEKDVTALEIAKDGIAIVVNKNNPVGDLTKEQIAKIYAGEITNWKELGGADKKINVIAREAGSGTTGAFEDIIMKKSDKEIAASVQRINQSEGIRATVAKSEEAIGFFSLYLADDSVKALKVEGVDATEENVKNGTYPVSRPFNYTYKTAPEGLAKAFVDFTLSDEGQAIVKEEGLISTK
ncbi:MAG: phosphate ABC transporter substrate-binding protein [Clostridia bacterium]|nr:phosphate ABC transporter substrate-binding protein [Clostridia bacterium]